MSLELWAGVECTVNRVHSRSFDQIARTGHDRRLDDLDRFAALGLKTLRYPVLWERVQAQGPDEYDWTWSDERLGHLRSLGIRPIVGLLHHGSGPGWTDLLDAKFPVKLARYALAFAERYPWVDAYVPVNEPLTTARFSGLYGHWYPHRKDNSSFVQALLNQIEGVGLAMKAIRTIRPDAELVQTEDLGKSFSTVSLRYQADFDNERRWLTFDLLMGRFVAGHPLWNFIFESGADRRQVDRIADHPCPPDIHGVNYYVTSERYLDEQIEDYPAETHGGNVFQRYADVDAVRARPEGLVGLGTLLREMWGRYGAPMAVTEAHIGCTREEQIRWLVDIWNQCRSLAEHGIECRAVTAWALLGAFDWNSLVTEERGDYEPGAFDVRTGEARPTAMAKVIRTLAAGKDFTSPILRTPGWWRRPVRLAEHLRSAPVLPAVLPGFPILVIGASESLGAALNCICENRGLPVRLISSQEVNVDDQDSLSRTVRKYRPWAIMDWSNCSLAREAGPLGTTALLGKIGHTGLQPSICQRAGIRCLTFAESFDSVLGTDPQNEPASSIQNHVLAESLPDLCHQLLDFLIDTEVGTWRLEDVGCSIGAPIRYSN